MTVEFRRRTLLPPKDVLGCLIDRIPKLTRSSLYQYSEEHFRYWGGAGGIGFAP